MGASSKDIAARASVSIDAKIGVAEARQIRELIEAGLFPKESGFFRDAIRHKLSRDQGGQVPRY